MGYKIDINSAEAFYENGVLKNAGCFFSADLCDLEVVPMQVERVHVVAFIDEGEAISTTLLNLNRLALIVRLPVDCPDVESAFASVDFSNLHRDHFIRLDRRFGFAKQE